MNERGLGASGGTFPLIRTLAAESVSLLPAKFGNTFDNSLLRVCVCVCGRVREADEGEDFQAAIKRC